MRRIKKYPEEDEEFLHPLWLGLIMLFAIIIVIGITCLLRRKYGLRIRHLCCKTRLNNEHHSKTNGHLPMTSPYNWGLAYVPPSSFSPKSYKLVHTFQMASLDRESPVQPIDSDNNSIENDVSSIANEADYVKKSLPQVPKNRSCQAARKFYANMRQTTQYPDSNSLDDSINEPSLLPINRLLKSTCPDKFNLFHTSDFFQSITDTME